MSSEFPAWMYGPEGASAIFESDADIPEGWADHPSKVGSIGPLDRDRDGAAGGSLPKKRKAVKRGDGTF